MHKLIAMLLCVILCVNMLMTVSARGGSGSIIMPEMPTINLDGIEFSTMPGYYQSFAAKHIKTDEDKGYIYVFRDWTVEGAEIDDTTSLQINFLMPNNDVILTPNYDLLGDINSDSRINAHDLIAFKRSLIAGCSEKVYDLNLDSKVNAIDYLALKYMLVKLYDVTDLYYTVNVEGNNAAKYMTPASLYGTLEVPFVAILEAYGAEVEWESDTVAVITYNEDRYTLNTAEYTMYLDGDDYNLLGSGAAGGLNSYTAGKRELYMEYTVVMIKLNDIIKDRKIINFDFEGRVVNVIDNPNF